MNAAQRYMKAQARRAKERETMGAPVAENIKPDSPKNIRAIANACKSRSERNAEDEINRILNLPIVQGIDKETFDAINELVVQPTELRKKPMSEGGDGFRLFPMQAQALYSYSLYDGVFAPIAVGGGKTLTSLLIAQEAFNKGHTKVMLIIPPTIVPQLVKDDLPSYRTLVHFNMPVHVLHGFKADKQLMIAKSRRPGLYVYTYSGLSSENAEAILEAVAPQTIIADEAHLLSATRESARARRFNHFLDEAGAELIAMSGTITKKEPIEYFSLLKHSLKENNPLPNIKTMATHWSECIGTKMDQDGGIECNMNRQKATGPLMPVINWAKMSFPKEEFETNLAGFRKAYRFRFMSTPGVESSGDDFLDIPLNIINDPSDNGPNEQGWDELQEFCRCLKDEMVTPGGEELEHAMHVWKWLYELEGAGFYNELYWPDMEWIEKYKNLSRSESRVLLERSQHWHEIYKDYVHEQAQFLKHCAKRGLDTPLLLGRSMSQHGPKEVGHALYESWVLKNEKEFEGRLTRLERAIRVCPFKINKAVDWARNTLPKNEGGIIWYKSKEVGLWLKEALEMADIKHVLHCPSGAKHDDEIRKVKTDHKKSIVIACSAHATGKNLQEIGWNRHVQWYQDAQLTEQCLGRTHRNGQKRKEVMTYVDVSSEFDRVMFAKTLNDAAYIHQTTGNQQKLMYAIHSPAPKLVPWEVQKQWGAQGAFSRQDKDVKKLLAKTFGK